MAKKKSAQKKSKKKVVKKATAKKAIKTKKTGTKVASKKKVAKKKVSKKTSKKAVKKSTAKKTTAKKTTKKVNAKKSVKTKTAPKASSKKTPAKKAPTGLTIGQAVPQFDVPATNGTFNISKFAGRNVVLYFYPKDDTPGCTLEGHDFSNNLDKFNTANTVIFGVSKDSMKSHESFCQKYNYKHALISDETGKLCDVFGVFKEKSMYGRTYMGVERSTFLIDKNGILVEAWRDVKVPGHAEAVFERVKKINQ